MRLLHLGFGHPITTRSKESISHRLAFNIFYCSFYNGAFNPLLKSIGLGENKVK